MADPNNEEIELVSSVDVASSRRGDAIGWAGRSKLWVGGRIGLSNGSAFSSALPAASLYRGLFCTTVVEMMQRPLRSQTFNRLANALQARAAELSECGGDVVFVHVNIKGVGVFNLRSPRRQLQPHPWEHGVL
jgi:hypothetical protein